MGSNFGELRFVIDEAMLDLFVFFCVLLEKIGVGEWEVKGLYMGNEEKDSIPSIYRNFIFIHVMWYMKWNIFVHYSSLYSFLLSYYKYELSTLISGDDSKNLWDIHKFSPFNQLFYIQELEIDNNINFCDNMMSCMNYYVKPICMLNVIYSIVKGVYN